MNTAVEFMWAILPVIQLVTKIRRASRSLARSRQPGAPPVARSRTDGKASEGAFAPNTLSEPGEGADAAGRATDASAGMASFTLGTGLRAANVTGLTWEQVDLSRKLAWAGKIAVPLNDTAMHHLFNDKLREWEEYYNYHRPHGALDGQTPYERLMAKTTASLSPRS
jgi:transposase InsO family protein